MKKRRPHLQLPLWFLSLVFLASPVIHTRARAAETAGLGAESPVVLPPFIVGRGTHHGWLYLRAGEMEFLSRCSALVTDQFATAQARAHQALRRLVPDRFLHPAGAVVFLLVPLDEKPRDGDGTGGKDLYASEAAAMAAELQRQGNRISRQFRFLPNMRLEDGYTTAVLTYIDPLKFKPRSIIVAPDYVRALLSRSQPTLPGWFIEGLVGVYARSDVQSDSLRIGPLRWADDEASAVWQTDPTASRTLLTAAELFTEPPSRLAAGKRGLWQVQAGLFIAWALAADGGAHRDALWRFTDLARDRPVSEELFAACFGFGFAELRDRLSDFLPHAVNRPTPLPALPAPRALEPTAAPMPAAPLQATRLLGEWERLQIPYIKTRYPQLTALYTDRARKTLRTPALSDAAAAELLALCESEEGNHAAAGELFGFARELGARGPRLHYEYARSTWLRAVAAQPEGATIGTVEAGLCRELLQPALRTAAPTPEALQLLSEIYLRSQLDLALEDAELLTAAARRFVRIPALGFRVALLFARERRFAESAAILTPALPFATDPRLATLMQELGERLKTQL